MDLLRRTRATWILLAKLTMERAVVRSGGRDQPQHDGAGEAGGSRSGAARQARMRRAIARARLTRMAAEGNLLPVLVAAVGIATVLASEFDQRDQARLDADAAQFDQRGRLHRRFRRQVQ